MKPPALSFARPRDLDEALQCFAQHGDEAVAVAGGQSLVAALNMRLFAPSVLVDIAHLNCLKFIERADGRLRLGALTRHRQVERDPVIAAAAPLLAKAMPHVAHIAIRNRGTLGGSLAYGDPAAEMPCCMLALDAVFILHGPNGERRVPAADFYHGLFDTARESDEVLTGIELPEAGADQVCGFAELAIRHGDYAIIGLAAVATKTDGALTDVRLAFLGAGDRPILAVEAMKRLEGWRGDKARLDAAAAALEADLDPADDLNATRAMRHHLARVLLGRVMSDTLAASETRQ